MRIEIEGLQQTLSEVLGRRVRGVEIEKIREGIAQDQGCSPEEIDNDIIHYLATTKQSLYDNLEDAWELYQERNQQPNAPRATTRRRRTLADLERDEGQHGRTAENYYR